MPSIFANRALRLALLVGLVLRATSTYLNRGWFIDDTYIYWRYAENFAHGLGLVYNAGDPTLGYTSPLYMGLLALASVVLPASAYPALSIAIGMVAFVVSLVLLDDLLRDAAPLGRHLALAAFAIYFPFIDAAVQGMETSVFLLTILWFLRSVVRSSRPLVVGASAAALILCRPEGIVIAVCGAVFAARRDLRRFLAAASFAAIPLLAWVAIATAYYGSPIPNSAVAKANSSIQPVASLLDAATYVVCLSAGLSDIVSRRVPAAIILVVALGLVTVLGAMLYVALRRRSAEALLVLGSLLLFLCFYFVGQPGRLFSWYGIPGVLLLVLSAAWTVPDIGHARRTNSILIGAFAVPILLAGAAMDQVRRERLFEVISSNYGAASDWILEHTHQGEWIATGDIGYIGWKTKRPIVDLGALVSRDIARMHADGQAYLSDIIARYRPSALILDTWTPEDEVAREDFIHYLAFRDETARSAFAQEYERMPAAIEVPMRKTVYLRRDHLTAPTESSHP